MVSEADGKNTEAEGTGNAANAEAEDGAGDRAGARQSSIRRSIRRYADGLRLAVSTLTVLRVGTAAAIGPGVVGAAMVCAPLVGAGLGLAAGLAGLAARGWTGSNLLAGVVGIGVLSALTRALHLDGLADTADGLGSGKPAAEALDVMKRSDIGPFGVATLVLMIVFQIGCLDAAFEHGRGLIGVIAAAVAGRLAVTAACTPPVPSARPEGLGAWVARTVRLRTAIVVGVVAVVVCGGLGTVPGIASDLAGSTLHERTETAVLAAVAVLAGLGAALLLLRRCVARFGGITGDVLGALVETGTATALLVVAFH